MKKKERKAYRTGIVWAIVGAAVVAVFWAVARTSPEPITPERIALRTPPPLYMYGFGSHQFHLERNTVSSGQTVGGVLHGLGVAYSEIDALMEKAEGIFRPYQWRQDETYITVRSKDSAQTLLYLIYEESPSRYVLFGCHDTLYVRGVERPVSIVRRAVAGVIEGSLYGTLDELGISAGLAVRLSEVYAWTIDFFRIQPGDRFKVIFEEKYVDDTIPIGAGRLLGAVFEHQGKPIYALYFSDTLSGFTGYFDREGKGLKKMFLKSPIEFARISSRFTMRRFHPVQKRWKAHLGTDYAAPTGTPIVTTAHGVVEKAGYTSANGNYVKVRHNGTYTTQYLHMSRFARGIRTGARVSQSQVIGYVGSTGLATGPHVCYRFWVNGRQVNALGLKLPNSEPIPQGHKAAFLRETTPILKEMNALRYPSSKE